MSFSTNTIALELFLIKKITSSLAVQPYSLPLSGVHLSDFQQYIQTSHHSLNCKLRKPALFSSSLCLPVHTVLYSVSLFASKDQVLFRCGFQSSGAQNSLSDSKDKSTAHLLLLVVMLPPDQNFDTRANTSRHDTTGV